MRVAGRLNSMGRCRGFTLTEVLVALAIMVILFALLFAPMLAGLDWVSTGRANVGLQDACRYAMEQIRRDLGESVYVYPTPGVYLPNRGVWVPNYSQIVFSPPDRDNFGKVYYPPRPAVEYVAAVGRNVTRVIRYAVHLVDPSQPYGEGNPFVLYRQELLYDTSQTYPLGSYDSGGTWQPGVPAGENALTPKRGATFVPTTSVCQSPGCETITEGYATRCPGCGSTSLMYLFKGVAFTPERVVGERLETTNGVLYTAKYGAWDGLSPKALGYGFLPDSVALHRSELDARVMLYVWDPSTSTYSSLRMGMDSYAAAVRTEQVNWDTETGQVTCGTPVGYRRLTHSLNNGWYVADNAAAPEIQPIYPGDTSVPPMDTGNTATVYRIDPAVIAGSPALIEPGTVKVRLVGFPGGVRREIDLKPTANFDQQTITRDQFCTLVYRRDYNNDGIPDGTCAEIRLSRYDPPTFAPLATYDLEISYLFRRNYTYDATRDAAGQDPFVSDLVKVDYSTRCIQNVSLSLQRFVDLVETGTPFVYILPSDEYPNEVTVREQITARNMLLDTGH